MMFKQSQALAAGTYGKVFMNDTFKVEVQDVPEPCSLRVFSPWRIWWIALHNSYMNTFGLTKSFPCISQCKVRNYVSPS